RIEPASEESSRLLKNETSKDEIASPVATRGSSSPIWSRRARCWLPFFNEKGASPGLRPLEPPLAACPDLARRFFSSLLSVRATAAAHQAHDRDQREQHGRRGRARDQD